MLNALAQTIETAGGEVEIIRLRDLPDSVLSQLLDMYATTRQVAWQMCAKRWYAGVN